MKLFLINSLRIISYVLLPIGSYKVISATTVLNKTVIVIGLIILPILVIFSLHPSTKVQNMGNEAIKSKTLPEVRHNFLRKKFHLHLLIVLGLLVAGLLPLISWVLLFLTATNPDCWEYHLSIVEIFPLLHCLISR